MSSVPNAINQWLRTIKKANCYRNKIKVYAPTCYDKCLPAVHKLVSDLNEIFKGSTIYDAQGTWLDPDTKELETEPVKVIEIASKCANPSQSRKFQKAIMEYSNKAAQKSMGIDQHEFFIARSPEIVKAYVKSLKRSGAEQ